MISTSILRYGAIGIASLALAGVAAASTATISGDTGAHSHNTAKTTNSWTNTISNHNSVGVGNVNAQGAKSGKASADENTTSGNVGSGNAANNNTTSTAVAITNGNGGVSMPGGSGDTATLSGNTGADSSNKVETKNTWTNTVTNCNNVDVLNLSMQGATSGKASADENTTVGNVTSGDASNTNSTSTSVTITN